MSHWPPVLSRTLRGMTLKQFDPVRLKVARPDLYLPCGATGVVVDVYEHPTLGYEVEFLRDDGRTIGIWALLPPEIEFDLRCMGQGQIVDPPGDDA